MFRAFLSLLLLQEEPIAYRIFENQEQCEECIALLHEGRIIFEVEQFQKSHSDPFTGGFRGNLQFIVKISKTDFEKANALFEALPVNYAPDHYLIDFTDQELTDVIIQKEEWSFNDQQIARKILIERNHPVNEDSIRTQQQQELTLKLKPKSGNRLFLLSGFIIPYLSFVMMHSYGYSFLFYVTFFVGLGVGLNYRYNYQRDTLGNRHFCYLPSIRFLGLMIIFNALISGTITIIYFLHRIF